MRREDVRVLVEFLRREPRSEPWALQREYRSHLEEQCGHDNPKPKQRCRFTAKRDDFLVDAELGEAGEIIGTRVVRGEGEAHELVHAQNRRGSSAL